MLCVYFEIPYERQLIRIAPLEIQTVLNNITGMAEANGAVSFKMPCASVYQFSMDSVAPVFSVNLFLRFLAEELRIRKERIIHYHVIIDRCEEGVAEDIIADHFTAYQSRLIPSRGFFASAEAELLLNPYINFEYAEKYSLYYCANFFVPKEKPTETAEAAYKIYLSDTVTWLHALYHFMLLYPLDEETVTADLLPEERTLYENGKQAISYFRKNRFRSSYPGYFTDAFLWYVRLYFRVFSKVQPDRGITVIYSQDHQDAANHILELIPSATLERREEQHTGIKNLSADFMQLAYLIILAAQFIFEDEIPAFFALFHKSPDFIVSLYEWLYAANIIEEKNDIYAVTPYTVETVSRQMGNKKEDTRQFITAFLWEKYQQGMLAPDENLKRIFDTFQFQLEGNFLFHYLFHKYSDAEIANLDIRPYKNSAFFPALEHYQKALQTAVEKHTPEAVYAVKNAVNAVQNHHFPAGEYRALSYIAQLHLSQNKIEDAITYFEYALDSAELLHDGGFICEALLHLGISAFVQNNLSAAGAYLERLAQSAAKHFEQDRKIPCLFMQGRVALQLGDYNKAEQLFQAAEDAAAVHFQHWIPLCRIWYARTLALKRQHLKAQQILTQRLQDSPDALLFLIESYLFAPMLQSDLLKLLPETYSAEPVSELYRSGFTMAEELVWGNLYQKPAEAVYYTVLSSYYRLKIALQRGDNSVQQYLDILEDTAREALRCKDMHAPIYGYLCYDAFILSKGPSSDTANGYLSRSFRALQKCMENMTENTIRDKFIFRNVWNTTLYAAAQKNKLI